MVLLKQQIETGFVIHSNKINYVCLYVCLFNYICLFNYMYVAIIICLFVYVATCVCVHVQIDRCAQLRRWARVGGLMQTTCMQVGMYVGGHLRVYTYVYISTNNSKIDKYIRKRIYIFNSLFSVLWKQSTRVFSGIGARLAVPCIPFVYTW